MINMDDFMLFQEDNDFNLINPFKKLSECNTDMILCDGPNQIQPTRLRLPSFFEQVGMVSNSNYYSTQVYNSSEGFQSFNQHEEEPVENQQTTKKEVLKQILKSKNQTKNIPKNFGKGIISFIQKNQRKLKLFIHNEGFNYHNLLDFLMIEKKYINTIADLRRLWTHESYGKILRIISNLFFRKYSLDYIFNSRISSFNSHIKNRGSLWYALKNPQNFNRIKLF